MAITDRALTVIFDNVGVSAEYTLLIIMLCAGLIFFATDFKLGLVVNFMIFSCCFLWMYSQGLNYVPFLIVSFIMLILMSLGFLMIQKATTSGGALI